MSKRLDLEQVRSEVLFMGWELVGEFSSLPTKTLYKHSLCQEVHNTSLANLRKTFRGGTTGCPNCSDPAQPNKLSDDEVENAFLNAGYRPLEDFQGMHVSRKCECCHCGSVRTPTLHNIRNHGAKCKNCAERVKGKVYRTPEEEAAYRLAKFGVSPLEPYPGALVYWKCKCKICSTPVEIRLGNAESVGWHCEACKYNQRAEKWTIHVKAYGWDVLFIPSKVSEKWHLRHRCGMSHWIDPGVGRCGEGCPSCAKSGFDSSKPAFVYLLRILDSETYLKVGITNFREQRFSQHRSNFAFEEIITIGPCRGSEARRKEKEVLEGWREQGFTVVDNLSSLPGGTETCLETPESLQIALDVLQASAHTPKQCFDQFVVRETTFNEVRKIFESHYTGTASVGKDVFGLYSGGLVGAATYGGCAYPGTAENFYPTNPKGVTELRRFYVMDEEMPPNVESWFLSRTMKLLPNDKEMVVAFSDPSAGHHGGIYQATNFFYVGTTGASYHYTDPHGNYVHKRNPWNKAKLRGMTERDYAAQEGLERVQDAPKYRYAYPLSKAARKYLQSVMLPYPKPASFTYNTVPTSQF